MKDFSENQPPAKNGRSTLIRAAGRFSFATLLSRILGYVRDASVAHFFGGAGVTDAFYTAFRTANLLRRLLGEGALSSSFVPVFTQSLKDASHEGTQKFLNALFTTLLALLAFLTLAGIFFAPQITFLIAPGFSRSADKFEMTIRLTRWMFPFFLFISLAALLTGVLNSLKHFFLSALAPSMLSVAEIAYLLLYVPIYAYFFRELSLEERIVGLAIAVVVGGALHFLVQLPQLWQERFTLGFSARWKHPQSMQVAKLMVPAVVGLSVDQVNAFVDTVCATFLVEGSVTALYNSNRLMQLPLALFGISIASVSLPVMSGHTAEKDFQKLSETLNESLRMVIFTVTPASIGLILLAHPIVHLLFEHGKFTPFAARITTQALWGYVIGLVAYSAVRVLANAYYSLQEPKVPVKVAAWCMLIHVVLNLFLMWPFGVAGLALATSLSSLANAVSLYVLIRRKLIDMGAQPIESAGGREIGLMFRKTLLASLGVALFVLFIRSPLLHLNTPLQVFLGVGGGTLIFLYLARRQKMQEQRSLFGMFGLKDEFED